MDHVPFHILNKFEYLHLLFVLYDIDFEIKENILFRFIHEKGEIKKYYHHNKKEIILQHNCDKPIKIYCCKHKIEKENNREHKEENIHHVLSYNIYEEIMKEVQ